MTFLFVSSTFECAVLEVESRPGWLHVDKEVFTVLSEESWRWSCSEVSCRTELY